MQPHVNRCRLGPKGSIRLISNDSAKPCAESARFTETADVGVSNHQRLLDDIFGRLIARNECQGIAESHISIPANQFAKRLHFFFVIWTDVSVFVLHLGVAIDVSL